jgi:deoxycytidylate deaminase
MVSNTIPATDLEMIDDAARAALRSTIKTHKTGAAIYDRKMRLLSIGWSHVPEGVLVETPWSKHAELHAWERCPRPERPYADSIVIVTITKNGYITMGAPCDACANLINGTPIKNVYYSQRLQS